MQQKFRVTFRNARNTLLGRKKLIEEYNNIFWTLNTALSNSEKTMPKEKYYACSKEFDELLETNWVSNGTGFSIEQFNQYDAKRAELKAKIEKGREIMAKYNIQPSVNTQNYQR